MFPRAIIWPEDALRPLLLRVLAVQTVLTRRRIRRLEEEGL